MKKHILHPKLSFENMRDVIEFAGNEFAGKTAYSFRQSPLDRDVIKISFHQFRNEVRALASELLYMGCAGKHCAVIGRLSYDWAVIYFAMLSIGAVIVPLDKEWNSSDLADTAAKAKAEFLFIDEDIADVTVIDWWTYEDPIAGLFYGKADKVKPIVRSRIKPYSGYQNWMAIQDTTENVRGCIKLAKSLNFEGVNAYSTFDPAFDKNFLTIADLAWNSAGVDDASEFDRRYAARYYPDRIEEALDAFSAVYEMTHDDVHQYWQNRLNRWLDYYMYCYRVPCVDEKGEPKLLIKNYPGECFRRLIESDRVDVPYLERVREYSARALKFFENSGRSDLYNDTWILTVRYYDRAADEFLTVLDLYDKYNGSNIGAEGVISELSRLVFEREALMNFAEEVKIEQNRPTLLRDMSVMRQWILDLLEYFKKECEMGREPKLDILNLDYAMSEKFWFLR